MVLQSIQSYFGTDDRRLRILFEGFRRWKRRNPIAARDCLRHFEEGLRRRIVWEEELLFPILDRRRSAAGGELLERMRAEHREIAHCLESMHGASTTEAEGQEAAEERVLRALTEHQEEESSVYPAIDSLLQDRERAGISQAIEAFSAAREASDWV